MIRFISSLYLAAAMLVALPAAAQQVNDILEASIIPGWVRPDGKHIAALHIKLSDGWKTYWRAPGDAGIPPQFLWSGARNLSSVAVSWPTPKRIEQSGVQTIGYEKSVTLPLTLTPMQKGKAITLAGEVVLGVCKDVCVPVTVKLSQDLPAGQTKPDPRIVAALADRPYTASEAKVSRVACRVSPLSDGLQLRAEVDLPRTGGEELAVIETDNPLIWVAQSRTTRTGNRLVAETELYHMEGRSFALDRSAVRITVLGSKYAVDIRGCPSG